MKMYYDLKIQDKTKREKKNARKFLENLRLVSKQRRGAHKFVINFVFIFFSGNWCMVVEDAVNKFSLQILF
jgi:hypothetical protein